MKERRETPLPAGKPLAASVQEHSTSCEHMGRQTVLSDIAGSHSGCYDDVGFGVNLIYCFLATHHGIIYGQRPLPSALDHCSLH